ncbi:Protein SERAC1 [Lachnellula suecica]|uniref:Protein SERAC1 n=1 Tax=Lachnellula suecica TaxID=602035 RepID=A0A8T9CAK1_9HELO|nr:Protein SERAC1 [Lachnellula suecica]
MVKVASKTVRVRDIQQINTIHDFKKVAVSLSSGTINRALRSSVPGNEDPKITFALQDGVNVGTITLPSENHKADALKGHATNWQFDDEFDGVTVLASPAKADLDICAIHGLNGNGFDTWVAERTGTMWLRDILPTTQPFDKARIMTFGYSSQLKDRGNLAGISEWAHHLLVCISSVRKTAEERQRPIIFICHSLGGIVAREINPPQAMVRLSGFSHKSEYKGINLIHCGLLFLSTPHSGTTQADWNNFIVAISHLTLGVRPELKAALESFNPISATGQEEFLNMKIQPPIEAFHETQETKVKGINRHIVTRQSSSLGSCIASPMLNADHSTICKFDSRFGGFMHVKDKLECLKDLLLPSESVAGPTQARVYDKPWHAPPNTLNCYQPKDQKFFVGQGLDERSKLKGREPDLNSLQTIVDKVDKDRRGDKATVAITGIGGIGKTATLLELAHKQRNERNIFYIHATDANAKSLHQAYLHIARLVGPEYLLRVDKGRNVHRLWNAESSEDKVERFKRWLQEPENAQALFLLDDLDVLQDSAMMAHALPCEAQNILYTTRNPVYREANVRERHQIRIPPMTLEGTLQIMEDVRASERDDFAADSDLNDRETLVSVATAVHGHPLAAANAMKYIVRILSLGNDTSAGQDFVAKMTSTEFEERRLFLDFRPHMERPSSIMETFRVSRKRLFNPRGGAWTLLQFLSILDTNHPNGDYWNFFLWLCSKVDEGELSDHAVLGARKTALLELMSQLETVSFGERVRTSEPFQFHTLWLECCRHAMEDKNRKRIIALMLSQYVKIRRDPEVTNNDRRLLDLHASYCFKVCSSFKMQPEDLGLATPTLVLVKKLEQRLADDQSTRQLLRVPQNWGGIGRFNNLLSSVESLVSDDDITGQVLTPASSEYGHEEIPRDIDFTIGDHHSQHSSHSQQEHIRKDGQCLIEDHYSDRDSTQQENSHKDEKPLIEDHSSSQDSTQQPQQESTEEKLPELVFYDKPTTQKKKGLLHRIRRRLRKSRKQKEL